MILDALILVDGARKNGWKALRRDASVRGAATKGFEAGKGLRHEIEVEPATKLEHFASLGRLVTGLIGVFTAAAIRIAAPERNSRHDLEPSR